jgi:ABC-2 type transport system permease protein
MSLLALQLRGELRKLFARKRTYIGFGAYIVLEILVLCLFQLQKVQASWKHMIERAGGGFEHYFSGTTLALIVVMATFLLTMLYLALVGGDVVAKEVEEGTMRMALCRPISRVRLLLLKYVACLIYTFALVAFVGGTALLACTLREGTGGLFAMAPEQNIVALYDTQEGMIRYGGALFFYALSFLSITTLAFMFSCFNMKPAAATIVTLSAFIIDWIFYHLPYFSSIKEYFLTHNMTTWVHIFVQRVPWTVMAEDYAYLLAVDATFVIIGVVTFQQRDFKS